MSSNFWLLEVESRNFPHAEKERTACEFAQICKQFFLSQLEKNHMTQLPAAKNLEDI